MDSANDEFGLPSLRAKTSSFPEERRVKYDTLSSALGMRIENDRRNGAAPFRGTPDAAVIRRDPARDEATVTRPAFVRDVEKILHNPYYTRYADKTQVFSFYRNDDITRRGYHVQLVSRIARTIGSVLGLNLDLIEAIAIGHDLGHTPFGHAGEAALSKLYHERTGRFFTHSAHGVRVLDRIIPCNLSLQSLNGILCHNGEIELREYRPRPMKSFGELDDALERCETDEDAGRALVPSTLEGCVVRVCDMIAYLGKDRQDAVRTGIVHDDDNFCGSVIGRINAEIINNLTVNIVENSYGKDHICMSGEYFDALARAKTDNYRRIYRNDAVQDVFRTTVEPMMAELYAYLIDELRRPSDDSLVYRHHVRLIEQSRYPRSAPYRNEDPDRIVVDYIASMTDDYFVELYAHLFPDSGRKIEYIGYF